MRGLLIAVGLAAAAAAATFARYQSFHPCAWLEHDTSRALGLPPFAAEARVRASFMLRGITEPGAYDCLRDWWHLKAEGGLAEEDGDTGS